MTPTVRKAKAKVIPMPPPSKAPVVKKTGRVWSSQAKAIFRWGAKYDPLSLYLMVRARAGTGKSTAIRELIEYCREQYIIICAFNKRIQEDMVAHIGRNSNAKVKTVHSIGKSFVSHAFPGVGVNDDNPRMRARKLTDFSVPEYTPLQIKTLVTKLHNKGREITPHATEPAHLKDIAYQFECYPDMAWESQGYGIDFVCEMALKAMELAANPRSFAMTGGIDFSDMIYLPLRLNLIHPFADMVIGDEVQDWTVAQLEIAQRALKPGGRMALFGDDRQGIYGFRGADVTALDRLKTALNARELPLTKSYRCPQVVARYVSERLVPDFEAIPTNVEGSITDIQEPALYDNVQPGDFILSRLNSPLVPIAIRLLRKDKKARIVGKNIGEALTALAGKLALSCTTIPEFIASVVRWRDEQIAHWAAAEREDRVEDVRERASMMVDLAEGAGDLDNFYTRLSALFTDETGNDTIILSSVHKAKGLEANRVFILARTLYTHGRSLEEENLEYVAVTRTKNDLFWVH